MSQKVRHNYVKLSGRIYRPIVKFTPAGMAVWEASLGVSRKVKDKWETDYFDLCALGEKAEEFAERVQEDKTDIEELTGYLRQERWEVEGPDKKKIKRSRVKVMVNSITLPISDCPPAANSNDEDVVF